MKVKEESNIDISFKKITTDQIIKVHQMSDGAETIGQSILNNQFYFYNNLETIDFTNGIEWEYEHSKSPATYQLYLHSLNTLCHLLNAYEHTNNEQYLDKAKEIFISWYEYASSNPDNNMLWYDHPTAYRTHNLIYLAIVLKDKLPISKDNYFSLLIKHAEFMYSDENYKKNNHGIMMDRSLILLGLTLNHPSSSTWIEKGMWRLKDTFNFSYSAQGVHLENSPDYHSIVRMLFQTVEDFLVKNNLSLGENVNSRLKLSDDYFKYLVKPDGNIPLIGDTELKFYGINNKIYDSFFDQNAGISILQAKNNNKPSDSTWISFISGFGTTTHKHFDDLSFNLHYMGNDLFVDSGKYSYGSSPIRGYVKSPRAHNVVAVKDKKRYKFNDNDFDNSYTKSFYTTPKMDIVQGVNNGFDNVQLMRSLIFIKPDIIIIVDEITCKSIKKISQYFNLAPHIKVIEKQVNLIKLSSNEVPIEIEQFRPNNKIYIHRAEINPPQAIISEKFNKIIKTKQIEFTKSITSEDVFLTVIKLGQEAITNFKDVNYNETDRKITLNCNNYNLEFSI